MKKFYLSLFFIILAAGSFSQTYSVYTAKTSGLWTLLSNWTITPRTDGVKKSKFIIPKNITMIVDNDVDRMGLGDMQIVIAGVMTLVPSTNMNLSENSSIELSNGTLIGLTANQKIKIGDEIKYKGNTDGTITGYFLADNTTGSSPAGFKSLGALPVNFTSFFISLSGKDAQLSWSTDREINNSHFDVERSFNGLDWERIGVVNGAINSSNTKNYSYNDKNVSNPVVYYRLRQVDIDGRAMYSSIKTIRLGEAVSPVKIVGFGQNVAIDLNQAIQNTIVVTVVNPNGQVIHKQTFAKPQYKINLTLSHAPAGLYVVHATDNNGLNVTKKIIL